MIPIAPGMTVPDTFALNATTAPGSPTLTMEFAAAEGRVVCTRLELRGDIDHPVTAAGVRLIRFDWLTQFAAAQNAILNVDEAGFTGGHDGLVARFERDVATATRKRSTYDLAEVGQLYMDAGGGDGAMRVLIEAFGVSEGTAWRLIRRARDAGHIPAEPLRRGPLTKREKGTK